MADAIRTAAREDRVLSGPATTFAIAEGINLLERDGKRHSVTIVREIK